MTYEIYNVYIHVRFPGQLKSVNKSNVHVSGAPDGVGITARCKAGTNLTVLLSQTRDICM